MIATTGLIKNNESIKYIIFGQTKPQIYKVVKINRRDAFYYAFCQ